MTKAGFWKKDWFLGLGVSLVLLVASGTQLQVIEGMERFAYDWGVRASARTPSDKISVIAIDKRSIDNIGRWPWSREIHAKMIERLADTKAKVIGYTVFFSEPQLDPGLAYVNKLLQAYQRLVPVNADPSAPPRGVSPELLQIGATLQEAESALNTDRKLAESFVKAGNVVLPLLFTFGEPRGKPDKPLPEFVRKNALSIQGGSGDLPLFTSGVEVPIVDSLGAAAAAVGHLNSVPDVDGAIRTEALAVTYYDEYYPSLAVMMVARSLNLTAKDIKIRPGEALQIGNFRVSADPTMQMFTYFYKDRDGRPAIQEDSFYDVASGKIPLEKYRDKIVLIGPTAAGVGSIFVTPVNPAMPAVEVQAHTVSSLLQGHFFVAPTWGWVAERLVYVLVAAYLIALLPRLSAGLGAVVSAGIVAILLTTHFVLMTGQGLWLQFMLPLALLIIGHVLLVTKRFVVTERGKEVSDAQSPVQPGRSRIPLHGGLRSEVPRHRSEVVARQADVGNACSRRRTDPSRRDPRARRRHREADARPLSSGKGARQGCHGRRISRQGSENRTRRCDQDHGAFPAIRGGRARRGQGAVFPRSRNRRPPEPYQYRDHLRRRRRARPVLHRHGTPEGPGPGSVHQTRQHPADRQGHLDCGEGGRCARLRAQAERGAPGREARQRHVRARKRRSQGDRFRNRPHYRFIQDQNRNGARYAVLHVAGAAPGQEDRRAQRFVLAGGKPLPAYLRQTAVRGRLDGATHVQDRQ